MASLTAIKAYLKAHPEEAVMSLELKAKLRAGVDKALTYYRAVHAYEAGDEEPIKEWVIEYVGARPDGFLWSVLRCDYLPYGGDMPFPFVCELLNHHTERLTAKLHIERLSNGDEIRHHFKPYGSYKFALLSPRFTRTPLILTP